jgi:cytochrome c oxidase cbb3-type subunit 3
MAVEERDPHTGYMTTGHEWNGIKELNTPVPRAVYFFLALTAAFAVIYWLLMPAFPLGRTYTKGLLKADERRTVQANLKEAAAERASWTTRIETESFKRIQADDPLMRHVRQTGRTLFRDNCAVCHGAEAKGGKGYPNLADAPWLWGGEPDTIAETLRVGINSNHKDTRVSQMPSFGQMLGRKEITSVIAYVQSLSDPALAVNPSAEAKAGKEIFLANCAACHGEDGKGNTDVGAPNLADTFWINGGDWDSIFRTVHGGRQGLMPHWEGRLTPLDRKILTLYVLDLRTAKQ